jgi:hypothetical protein
MRDRPSEKQLSKLPKIVQLYIKDLVREREVAVKKLNDTLDTQTKSPFYFDSIECTGEEQGPTQKRTYIQTYQIDLEHDGVHLNVMLRDGYIDIKWDGIDRSLKETAFIPHSFQCARLVCKENMS